MAGLHGVEDRRMGEADTLRRAGRAGLIEDECLTGLHQRASIDEFAEAELGALQIAENADGAAMLGRHVTDGAHERMRRFRARMAHVDAEHVRAGQEEALDCFGRGRRGSKRRDYLDPPITSHFPSASL
jgi:hypothetical protein